MGFPYHYSWRNAYIWTSLQSSFTITLDDIICTDVYWSSCKFLHRHNCGHGEDIFLTCSGSTITCPPGEYRYEASSGQYCKPCSSSSYKPNEGPEPLCRRCPDNAVATTDGTYCNCSAGTFWKEPNCLKCPSTASSVPGSKYCNCSAGSFWEETLSTCLSCPAGTSSQDGAFRCHACPEGSDSLDGGKSCSCPAGMIWKEKQFWSPCQKCPANTYKKEEMKACVSCPPTTTSLEGSDHCSCKSGMYWNTTHSHCDICKPGSVSRMGSLHCQKCPPGSNVTHNNEDCTCPGGIRWEWNKDGVGSCRHISSSKGSMSTEVLGTLTGILVVLCLVQGYFLIRKTKSWTVLKERIGRILTREKRENSAEEKEEIPQVVYNASADRVCNEEQVEEGKSTSKEEGEFDNIYGKVHSEEA